MQTKKGKLAETLRQIKERFAESPNKMEWAAIEAVLRFVDDGEISQLFHEIREIVIQFDEQSRDKAIKEALEPQRKWREETNDQIDKMIVDTCPVDQEATDGR